MIKLIKLDTRHPPFWTGVSRRSEEVLDDALIVSDADAETIYGLDLNNLPDGARIDTDQVMIHAGSVVRHTEGQDKVNHFTRQRVEGDLFERDLILDRNLQSLVDFITSRSGLMCSSPAVAMADGKALTVADLPLTNFPEWFIVALGARCIYGTPTINMGVRVASRTPTVGQNVGATLVECDVTQQTLWTATDVDDLPTVSEGGLEVYLYNESGSEAVLSGWAALLPKTFETLVA